MMNSKQAVSIHGPLNHGSIHGRYTPPYRNQDTIRRMANPSGNIFGGLDDSFLARAEALAAADISKAPSGPLVKPDSIYGHTPDMSGHNGPGPRGQMQLHGFSAPGESMLDQLSSVSMPGLTSINTDHNGMMATHPHTPQMYSQTYTHPTNTMSNTHHPGIGTNPMLMHPQAGHPEMDCDPRELEAFAEHFKQRRIKLGVTQADVGNALGKLKLPGVGSLSQSTICRFESLTLSHNNMVALKPVLQAWLEDAEKAARETKQNELYQLTDKKRKRTSIAAPEKRSLEAYFAIQPRPSGEKIAQIAEKLDLKKNVVRVWFCNQRQKQKRMKFSAVMGPHSHQNGPL